MDTVALRQKILDLAIRGKLVPQDPNDEPASVLLERIRAEKQQMVKDGKLKAKDIKNDTIIFKGEDNLHYEKFQDGTVKCIDDEIPFEVPEGWEWARLGSIFSTLTGSTPATKDKSLYGEEYPFYKPADLNGGFMITDSIDHVSEKGYLSGRIVVPDTVLVTCIGATIGKTGIIRNAGICNQQINAILPRSEINTEYVYFLMCSKYEQNQIYANASATTLPLLNKSQFDKLLVPIPPIMAQVAIVKVIINLLNYVDLLEEDKIKLTSSIGSVKSKILDLAIRGKLVPQDSNDEPASVLLERIRAEKEELIKQGKIKRDKNESVIYKGDDNSYYEKFTDGTFECIDEQIPFSLPTGWAWERLGNITNIARGGSPRPIKAFITNESNGVNWIKIGDTEKEGKYIFSTIEKIKPEGVSKSRYVKSGDFLLTNSMSFGRPYILKTDGCIHDGWLMIGNIEPVFNQDYLYYALSVDFMYKILAVLAGGSTVDNLNSDLVKSVLFPIPPKQEQERIASTIEKCLSLTEKAKNFLS
ncbi:restriction endonuclease subunit S [Campylobacter hyointestinalis]|uniref:restriction endonuclease subunit S n=1 Tax=Campylobacter hyointestinalis TaxID=198 RepID=UPI000723F56D|nr:restriction endonuclease subunit S [Campylobacter hyointestinalis]CUU81404.1 putative type I restriction-modification system%2C S subunit [Campylobacter hyointestinalis subsp. hyointestinalis]